MNAITAKPAGCTNFKLRQLLRRVARLYDLEMAATGLKTTQYSLLSYIVKTGPIAPGQLAREMGMDASTLTRNLKPLLAQGLVQQGPGDNARQRRIELTPQGRARRQSAQTQWKAAQVKLNDLLGASRVNELHALIELFQYLQVLLAKSISKPYRYETSRDALDLLKIIGKLLR